VTCLPLSRRQYPRTHAESRADPPERVTLGNAEVECAPMIRCEAPGVAIGTAALAGEEVAAARAGQ